MGFLLFTESGTFDPVAMGLTINDMIYVTAVGGGGGGGFRAHSGNSGTRDCPGGNGGTSSFGSYVTAVGGAGGLATSGINAAQGAYVVSQVSGGAPGWIPELMMGGYTGIRTPSELCASRMTDSSTSVRVFKYNPLLGGLPAESIPYVKVEQEPIMVAGNVQLISPILTPAYSDSYWSVLSVYYPWRIAGGCGYAGYNDYDGTSESERRCSLATGGAGYGAGGGGARSSYPSTSSRASDYARVYTTGNGGNSGSVVSKLVTLTSLSKIAVSVGGGGAGGYVTTTTSDTALKAGPGASGTPGTFGRNAGYANRGGYGAVPGGHGFTDITGANGGGGGAGGCVAIWW